MRLCLLVSLVERQFPYYTTIHLAQEAARRGHDVFFTSISQLTLTERGEFIANCVKAPKDGSPCRNQFLENCQNQTPRLQNLQSMDALFLRFNPNAPFTASNPTIPNVLQYCRLLKQQGVTVFNDPENVLFASSKLFLSEVDPSLRPKQLVSREPEQIKAFIDRLNAPVVIKPLCGFGGQDVFFVSSPNEVNLNQILATVTKNNYALVEHYIDAAREGDKRLLLLAGRPIQTQGQTAIFRRVSPKGELRSNMHIGAMRQKTEFTQSDQQIADSLRPLLQNRGLYLVGVDIAGDKLIEVNVFCPGGIQNINELYAINVSKPIVNDLEARLSV